MLGWLYLLFFAALLSSQSAMDLFSASLFGFIVTMWLRRKGTNQGFVFPRFGIEKIFMFWVLVIFAGLWLHRQTETPLVKNVLEFRWILEFYIYVAGLRLLWPEEEDFKKLLPVVALASGYALLVYFLKYDLIFETWADGVRNRFVHENGGRYRTGGLFNNPMPFAHTYGPYGILMLGPLFYFDWAKKNWLWVVLTGLTLTAVVLSYTRGVWIGMAVAIIAMGFFTSWKKGLATLTGLIVIFGLMMATIAPIRERVLFSLTPEKTYDSERMTIWEANWMIFQENPVLGLGYSENGRRLREYYDRMGVREDMLADHAHNQYLHFLAGTGVLGLLCFVFVIAQMFRLHFQAFRFFSQKKLDPFWSGLSLGVLGAEICFFVAAFTESNFSIAKNRYAILMVWALGCWLWYKAQSENMKKNGVTPSVA